MNNLELIGSLDFAIEKCITENALITSDKLSSDESIHFYKGALYYEDGCRIGFNLSSGIQFLHDQEWTKDAKWYLVTYLTPEQEKAIADLHKLASRTYVPDFAERFRKIVRML